MTDKRVRWACGDKRCPTPGLCADAGECLHPIEPSVIGGAALISFPITICKHGRDLTVTGCRLCDDKVRSERDALKAALRNRTIKFVGGYVWCELCDCRWLAGDKREGHAEGCLNAPEDAP